MCWILSLIGVSIVGCRCGFFKRVYSTESIVLNAKTSAPRPRIVPHPKGCLDDIPELRLKSFELGLTVPVSPWKQLDFRDFRVIFRKKH